MMQNQMETNLENDIEAGLKQDFKVRISKRLGFPILGVLRMRIVAFWVTHGRP